jgi:hypothetical protein
MSDEDDKREHPRYAIGLDVTAEHPGGKVAGQTRDLSRGGFCMLSEEAIPIGQACDVRVALVFSENKFSEHLKLNATAVWCTRIKESHQIGFKFGHISPQNRGYLDLFMKFLAQGQENVDSGTDDDESEEDPFGA